MKFGKFFAILSGVSMFLLFSLDAGADNWGISFNSHGYRGGYGWEMDSGGHGHRGHRGHGGHRRHWNHRHFHGPHVNLYLPYAYGGNYARGVEVNRDETVVVNIPNDNGSFTPVTLRRSNGSYIGPRGEYYMTMPTTEQLKMAYGLQMTPDAGK